MKSRGSSRWKGIKDKILYGGAERKGERKQKKCRKEAIYFCIPYYFIKYKIWIKIIRLDGIGKRIRFRD